MSTILGVSGANKECKEIYIGSDGINKKFKEGYIGLGGINRKIYTGTLFELSNVIIDNTIKNFSSLIIPNRITLNIYSIGTANYGAGTNSRVYGSTCLMLYTTSNFVLILENVYDYQRNDDSLIEGPMIWFRLNGVDQDWSYGKGFYGANSTFDIEFTSNAFKIYRNEELYEIIYYSEVGLSSKPIFNSYKASVSDTSKVTGSITNFIIK